jgi:hypothetical protein
MQDLARNRQRQLYDLAFNPAIVVPALGGEFVEGTRNLLAFFLEGSAQFGARLLLFLQASLFQGFGLLEPTSVIHWIFGIRNGAGQ